MQELFSQQQVSLQKETTTKSYLDAYNGLNKAQKDAVDTIHGPVMVIAGPGTGKTEMLAVRVGNILLQPDVAPSNILCLTFSNAGVQSMRERLKQLIGPTAELIGIYTFHSFCNKVIQKVGGEDRFDTRALINDTQRYLLLEKLLSTKELAGEHTCVKPPSGSKLNSLSAILSDMKKEGINAQVLNKHIDHIIANELPFDEKLTYKNQKELNAKGKEAAARLESFRSIGGIYEAYNQQLKDLGLFEYEDMIDAAMAVLEGDESITLDYQEQYQYILVDEFQDTNKKQLDLLYKLITPEQPNIFFVGDDDQCIYKFQGANSENITWVQKLLKGIKVIELDKNYRSTQDILDFSKGLLTKNKSTSTYKTKLLTAARADLSALATEIYMQEYASYEHEAYHICQKIMQILQTGIPASEIAVLYRKRKLADPVVKWLNHFNIPYIKKAAKQNLLKTPVGKEILSLLYYLHSKDNHLEAADGHLLKYLLTKEGLLQAFPLYESYRQGHGQGDGTTVTFREWLEVRTEPAAQRIVALLKQAEELTAVWGEDITQESLQRLFNMVGQQGEQLALKNALENLVLTGSSYTWASLTDFLSYTESYSLNTLSIDTEELPEDKVVLSTVHGSKGLEYHTVFIIGCSTNHWETAQEPTEQIGVPRNLKKYLNRLGDDIDDLRRLLYVGLTRSKVNLYLSCAQNFKSKRNIPKPSCMLYELSQVSGLPIQKTSPITLPAIQVDTYTIDAKHPLRKWLDDKCSSFALSATSINTFIGCENQFLLNHLLKLPSAGTEALAFGSAIHDTLEALANAYHKRKPQEHEVLTIWKEKMQTYFTSFHPTHREGYFNHGKEVLGSYIDESWSVVAEKPICEVSIQVVVNGIPLKGKLDRIDIHAKGLALIDYKTGYDKKPEPFVSLEEPGNSFWRQGAIYADLIKGHYAQEASSIVFHFVEHNKRQPFLTEEVPAEWYSFLDQMWTQVQQYRFKKHCANEECHYCALASELTSTTNRYD